MRDLRVKVTQCAVVTFVNSKGEHVVLPLIAHDGGWRQLGSYQVYGASASDPTYSAVHALPHKWRPTQRILSAIRKAK
jgi:hypothetical protein